MFKNTAKLLLVVSLASTISLPSYARGFGGGFRGFGGGGFDRGGFDRGGGGFGRGGGDFARGGAGHDYAGGGFGGREAHPNFGGGFSDASAGKGVVTNHPNYGAGGEGFGHAGQFPNHSQFPTDGGFGNASGNRVPQNFDKNSFNGNNINHSNFNNDNFNKNVNVNNINANGYHGYHNNYGYGGYHPYGGYGYHGYGYGYNPTAMMWSFAGISSLTTLTTFLGMSAIMGASGGGSSKKQPASYSNVTYNGGNVYINGEPQGSSEAFYKQAQQLAASAYNTPYTAAPVALTNAAYPGMPVAGGLAPGVATASAYNGQNPTAAIGAAQGQASAADAAGEWKPLGTFSLAEPGQTQSNMMLQLDINKDGMLHGTYYNQLTMETSQVYGALDKATQRISWTIGTNPSTVFDAGLGDLIKDESSVLVHYSPTNTQRMALLRLKQAPANGMPLPGSPEQGVPVQMPAAQPG